jgi:hypothetical protein
MSKFAAAVQRVFDVPPKELEERPCPDQYVGELGQLRAAGGITSRFPVSARKRRSAVLMILESPHIEEFKGEPGPARGPTGQRIAKYTLSVPGLGDRSNSSLLLVNAIQHQCSLGQPTNQHRDKVFIAAWQDFGRSDFIDRLTAVYQSGDLVICACTKGVEKTVNKSLRQLVYEALVEALPKGAQVLRRTHPVSWISERHRNSEWC